MQRTARSYMHCRRFLSLSKKHRKPTGSATESVEDELEVVKYMYGKRSNRERTDSVSGDMLRERLHHRHKMDQMVIRPDVVSYLKDMGFGKKKRSGGTYSRLPVDPFSASGFSKTDPKTATAAGGHGLHLASASKNWPVFKHMLPEMAFAGHSNSGKSTLVNAMVGVAPRSGPASVNERAGWTDRICFYQLGRKPPQLTLADLPGYGHAVASGALKRAWRDMTRDYLRSRSHSVLSRCFVLVDSVRGLCAEDKSLLLFLQKHGVPWQVLLTKCDLLTLEQTAQSMCAVWDDLQCILQTDPLSMNADADSVDECGDRETLAACSDDDRYNDGLLNNDSGVTDTTCVDSMSASDAERLMRIIDGEMGTDTAADGAGRTDRDAGREALVGNMPAFSVSGMKKLLLPVSASTGAGVSALWAVLKECADETSCPPLSPTAVREHLRAQVARKQRAQELAAIFDRTDNNKTKQRVRKKK